MTITQTALIAISVTSATYGALSLTYAGVLAARAVMATRKRVGGLTFFRVGRYQVSICKPRAASVITADPPVVMFTTASHPSAMVGRKAPQSATLADGRPSMGSRACRCRIAAPALENLAEIQSRTCPMAS